MEFINSIRHNINECFNKVPKNDEINLRDIRARLETIEQFKQLKNDLNVLVLDLDTKIDEIVKIQQEELHYINKLLTRGKSTSVTSVTSGTSSTNVTSVTTLSASSSSSSLAPTDNVMITSTLGLKAIKVDDFDMVKQDGNLYYVAMFNHFAFRLSDHLFHGNIGTIFLHENKYPLKIKDCKYGLNCTKKQTCEFYHDPLLYSTNDVRNFIANSWLYNNNVKCRRFGSLDNLAKDLAHLTLEEVNRYYCQISHDVLCGLLMAQYFEKINE